MVHCESGKHRISGMPTGMGLKGAAFVLLLLFLALPAHAGGAAAPLRLAFSPKKVGPGDILVITVKNAGGPVEGTFDGKKIFFNPSKESYRAIVGIGLRMKPGRYSLDIAANGHRRHRLVRVSRKTYPVQRLTLPKDMVVLSPENEARADREQRMLSEIWPKNTERLWSGDFINPREGKIVTQFGLRRLINGLPRSPHTGVDVSADAGDPVRAPNNARVALVDDLFFSGNSVILDHGQGIYSMFFHLSKILVKPGQSVNKGDVIGLVGSTGRSTGPHLHWGIRVEDARVNPLELIRLDLE